MNKRIKYISYFDTQDSEVKRNYITSATNKMLSICDALNDIGYNVNIISMSEVTESKFKFYRASTKKLNNHLTLKLFSSWGGNGKISRKIKYIWHLIQMFIYLVLNCKKEEIVLVYHSLGFYNIIIWAKKIRGFKLFLEVEEIYQDVSKPKFNSMAKNEYRMINLADAYIFPTSLLDKKLNIKHLPSIIIHGTYTVEPQIGEKFEDGKIHVLYAGTFDPRKGGAAAAAAAAYLPANYHIHICGFGNEHDTEIIKKIIADASTNSCASLSFEGLKLGREYIEFIQKCDIGLSTQDPEAAFNSTSFPSKILSYMSNGLSVVSVKIPAISTSAIGKYLCYYHNQTPEDIAQAILSAPTANSNRNVIADLGKKFRKELSDILDAI